MPASPVRQSPRRTAIGQAAVEVLARHGSRGLTHRAVDRELGLAPGSTSAYFRTRAALLGAAAEQLAELDRDDPPAPALALEDQSSPAAAALAADAVARRLADARRSRELARRELDLEAIRRPELDELLAAERARRLAFAARLLRNVGAADPAAHAPALAALIDGLVAGAIVDAGAPVMPRSLGAQFETFLRACGGR